MLEKSENPPLMPGTKSSRCHHPQTSAPQRPATRKQVIPAVTNSYKKPAIAEFMEDLPVQTSRKVLKNARIKSGKIKFLTFS